ncbi:MAG: hypothetical protein HY904_14445 [Deltaproteobacteria bacterium]|nr:hypothetical protein [Deltaproteobacteria bacterium]
MDVTIPLTGEVLGADGFFVLAHPGGAPDLLARADLVDARVDLQNGPDSVQVRWHGEVVDALGYGTFQAGDTFGGEGSPAAPAGPGQSLTRRASHADTDDNAADFSVDAAPTPHGDPCSGGACPVACTDECGCDAGWL